jgi:hypothetical protein
MPDIEIAKNHRIFMPKQSLSFDVVALVAKVEEFAHIREGEANTLRDLRVFAAEAAGLVDCGATKGWAMCYNGHNSRMCQRHSYERAEDHRRELARVYAELQKRGIDIHVSFGKPGKPSATEAKEAP